MFKKILVCLDGSEIAERILPFVKEQALAMGSEVILLRVVSLPANLTLGVPGFPSVPFHTSVMPEQLKKEYSIAESYLKQVAQPILEQGIKVKCETQLGLPGPAL